VPFPAGLITALNNVYGVSRHKAVWVLAEEISKVVPQKMELEGLIEAWNGISSQVASGDLAEDAEPDSQQSSAAGKEDITAVASSSSWSSSSGSSSSGSTVVAISLAERASIREGIHIRVIRALGNVGACLSTPHAAQIASALFQRLCAFQYEPPVIQVTS